MADAQLGKGGGRRAQRGNVRKRNESELSKSEAVAGGVGGVEKGGGREERWEEETEGASMQESRRVSRWHRVRKRWTEVRWWRGDGAGEE